MRFAAARNSWMRALCVLAFLCVPLASFAQTSEPLKFPELTGRVVDRANLLSASQVSELTRKLEELEQKTTAQLVVVTLTSLSGRTIEEYGVELGRHWGIGQKATNNGALLIVAPNERKVRIEVGYGAEGVLPDAVTSLIIQRAIIPKFRANDYAGGIVAGADEIIKVLSGAGDEWKKVPREDAPWWVDAIVIAIFFIPFIFVPLTIFLVIRSITRNVMRDMKSKKGKKRGFWDSLGGSSSSSWGSSSSSSSWSSSSSSSSSGSFSGGGGSFGGGGSSGSW
jgi:uncharacterized protein